ncbi:amidohydrolase family protein [Dongia sp.]|uniref:amidohydrolase family protein n=1 Tax=Dongia sp. TaxID=1977262 RepID=UPI003751519C
MPTPIIDTHLHLVYRERFSYPWLGDVTPLNRDFTLETYRPQAEAAGIAQSIHMEVDVVEADQLRETDFVTSLGGSVVAAIASCRPESRDFPAQLEKLAQNPKVKGLRRILHTSPDELSQAPLFTANLQRLAAHRLSFDLCVLARQLPQALRIARACPEVQFILDHCGVPAVKERALDPWRVDIAALAAEPNVACKISGVVAYAEQNWTVDDLRPFVEHVIESFGWDRVVWGSDWPVCTLIADLGRWVAATRAIIAGESASNQAKLLNGNARRIYRLN